MGGERQKSRYQLALFAESRGEAPMAAGEGPEPSMAESGTESRAEDEQLMGQGSEPRERSAAMERVHVQSRRTGVDGDDRTK